MPSSAAWRQKRLSLATTNYPLSSASRPSMNSICHLARADTRHGNMMEDGCALQATSPTSVVTVQLTPPNVKARISTISEEGTEVTLLDEDTRQIPRRCFADEVEEDDDVTSLATPFSSPPIRKTKSLLDQCQSISITPETPLKVPFCGAGVCWKKAEGHRSPSALEAPSAIPVQQYILSFLGNRHASNCWADHLPFVFSHEKENEPDEATVFQRALLRRRPSQMKAHRRHLDELRRNLDPFNARSPNRDFYRSTSQKIRSEHKAKPQRPSFDDASSLKNPLWRAFACHRVDTDSIVEETVFLSGDGYESDPELFGKTTSTRSPLRAKNDPSARRLFPLDIMGDEESIKEAVKSVWNEKWTLVLHPRNERPQAMQVWMERGQRLQHRVVHPKLCWKALPKRGDRKLTSESCSVDILDIQRILPLQQDDQERQLYPLAKPQCSFLVKSVEGGHFCWQAPSSLDRDHLLTSWKLTVARLGSALVTGDDDGIEECFAPVEAGVGFIFHGK